MVLAKIKDAISNYVAKVGRDGELFVTAHSYPAEDSSVKELPFRQYFKDSAGSFDMAVNGSVNNVDFTINASSEFDFYIGYISVEIGATGTPNLNDFGNLPALVNGVGWFLNNEDEDEYVLDEAIKSNKDFIRIGTDTPSIGTGVEAFLADVSGGAAEKSYLPRIDMTESFKLTHGLRLKRSSSDQLIFRVRDDLSALTTFNIVAYGKRIKY